MHWSGLANALVAVDQCIAQCRPMHCSRPTDALEKRRQGVKVKFITASIPSAMGKGKRGYRGKIVDRSTRSFDDIADPRGDERENPPSFNDSQSL